MSQLSTRTPSKFSLSSQSSTKQPESYAKVKSHFANFFQETNFNTSQNQQDFIPGNLKMDQGGLQTEQSFQKGHKAKGGFPRLNAPFLYSPQGLQTNFFQDTPELMYSPSANYTPKKVNSISTFNALPCPSLNSVIQSICRKKSEHTVGSSIYKLTTVQPNLIGYGVKTNYRDPAQALANHDNSFSINNQPSIEEDFALTTSDRTFMDIKYPTMRNLVGKIPHSPARVFAFSKSQSDRSVGNNDILAKPYTAQSQFRKDAILNGQLKKQTVLSMIKGKVEESIKRETRDFKTAKVKRKIFLSVQVPSSTNKIIPNSFMSPKLSDLEKSGARLPLENIKDTEPTAATNRCDTIPGNSPKKKDVRKAGTFNTNFTMAKIEKIALKELRARKGLAKSVVNQGRQGPVDEVPFSPLKAKATKGYHPFFSADGEDDGAYQLLRATDGTVQRNVLRKRLIRILGKMRRLKLTPKDLLKQDKIFSLTPFEKQGSKKLIAAAKSGNASLVRDILEKHNRYLVYDFDQVHQTALHWAARKGFDEVVDVLIQKGADVNARDIAGRTPLYFALKHNHILVTKYLLGNQADPWSTKDCDYKELVRDNPTIKYYIQKAKQLHILMKMTPPEMRDSLWEKEGLRLIVNMTFNIDRYEQMNNN